MTFDFWQDTVIYEGKTLPVGTLACVALNVSADSIAKANEQCEKINLLLGTLNAGQDAYALCPIAVSYTHLSHKRIAALGVPQAPFSVCSILPNTSATFAHSGLAG